VLVAYADWQRRSSPRPEAVLAVAAESGAAGVLLDTAFKDRGGLFQLLTRDAVAAWVTHVHAAGLLVALAGSLGGDDLAIARAVGADVAGVRRAACEGGRRGRVRRALVAALAARAAGRVRPLPPGTRAATTTFA
jgi:uncharacterized protein (UPF0264 family)